MASKLYVGNLPFHFTTQDLEQLFAPHGTVRAVQIVMDRETGRSRGFGFVEFDQAESVPAAISALHGTDVGGRMLTVNEAREREPGAFGNARPPRPPRQDGPGRGPRGADEFTPRPSGAPRSGGAGSGFAPRAPSGGFHGGGGFRPGGQGGRGDRGDRGERGGRSAPEKHSDGERGRGGRGRSKDWLREDDE